MSVGIRPQLAKAMRHWPEPAITVSAPHLSEFYCMGLRRYLAMLSGALPFIAMRTNEEERELRWITTFLRAPGDF